MTISSADIVYRLSGEGSNADPLLSFGGAKSSVAVSQLFGTIDSAEAAAGSVKYLCVYLHNANGVDTMTAPKLFVLINTPSADTTIEIGIGAAGVNGTETAVANITTAPAGVSFSAPSTLGAALAMSNIPAGQHQSFWVKRTVNAGASALDNDGCTLLTSL